MARPATIQPTLDANGNPIDTYTSGNSLTQTGSSGTSQTAGLNQNQYTPAQQALQGQDTSQISGLLNGSSSPAASLGFDPSVWQSMVTNFNENVAPQLAAQYGAGSPVIGGQLSNLLLNATSQSSQQAWNNQQNLLGDAQSNAFTPVGATSGTSQTQGQNSSDYTSQQQNTTQSGANISSLANSAGAALSNAGTAPNLPSITLPGGQPGATLP
jgi:hypothetical protein